MCKNLELIDRWKSIDDKNSPINNYLFYINSKLCLAFCHNPFDDTKLMFYFHMDNATIQSTTFCYDYYLIPIHYIAKKWLELKYEEYKEVDPFVNMIFRQHMLKKRMKKIEKILHSGTYT